MLKTALLSSLVCLLVVGAASAATITIVNLDGSNEGFNDNTPATPVGGNSGTTIGEQRLIVFQTAAAIWGSLLPSDVEIRVNARFNPQSCDATSAVLGSAGPIDVIRDFSGAIETGTWYHVALANRLAGVDLEPGASDISTTFNSSIDNNNNCLSGTNWYYGLDGNEGSDVELLPVVLHELGHGLGFSTQVSSGGSELGGFPDIYETFLFDNTTGLHWDDMNNSQRAASAVNSGNVVWDGATVTGDVQNWVGGTPTMCVNVGAGLPSEITIGTANFGPDLTEIGVTGDVVLVDDGVGTVTDACDPPLVNGAAVSGKIALIDRGTCTFASKAVAAQAEGAIAVVIANNVGTGAITLGGSDPTVTIPVVSVSLADGNLIKAALGTGVNITLKLDVNTPAGLDGSGRLKIYTPNPYEGGSSVSHWDTSALPSLLMEPAISGNLSSSVDVTLAHFADIGWLNFPVGIPDPDLPQPRDRELRLVRNHPNPFNPSTLIRYEVPSTQDVQLSIYDVQGRLIRDLFEGPKNTGVFEIEWDGRDNRGGEVVSGVYFVRLAGETANATMKIVLVK